MKNYKQFRGHDGKFKKRSKHVTLAILLGVIAFGFAYTLILPADTYVAPVAPVVEVRSNIEKLTDNVAKKYTIFTAVEKELEEVGGRYDVALEEYNKALEALNTYIQF